VIDVSGQLLDYAWVFVTRGWGAIILVSLACTVGARTNVFRRVLSRILRACHRPVWHASSLVAGLSLVVSSSVFLQRGEPLPHSPDEFATLLVADTLSLGRLANPPPELWQHFETQIVLVRPTYASAYPLGNGAMLLLGRLLAGVEIAGVWLASAAAAAITVWAARAWLPASWSLFAGILIALHPTFTWWNIGYMGGSLSACGAGLLLGAAQRMLRKPSMSLGALAGAGIALLAHTRPWEGLLFTTGVAILVLTAGWTRVAMVLRNSVPGIVVVAASVWLIALHNHAVTGSYSRLPHEEFDRQYQVAPNFLWQDPRPMPAYANDDMRLAYARTYMTHYERIWEAGGVVEVLIVSKLSRMRDFLFPTRHLPRPALVESLHPLFFVPLLLLPLSSRRRATRRLLLVFGVFLVAPFATAWWVSSQYLAPAATLIAILYMVLARELVARWPRAGSTLVLALLAGGVAYGIGAARVIADMPQPRAEARRKAAEAELARMGGRHLILIPSRTGVVVYNEADLESAGVIWARERDASSNEALRDSYRDRVVWQLSGKRETFRLTRAE
jgi:hypothetical protein